MMTIYLAPTETIDFDAPNVRAKARELAASIADEQALVARYFTFVRDAIKHSWDHRLNPVTCRASDVLRHGTGYCYAKSHLLAALLRASGIPAGLCYQRLAVGDAGPPYCLHGLNAVYLRDLGWYRLDARGNKPGIATRFSPPHEALAYPASGPGEQDCPHIFAEPLPVVTAALTQYADIHLIDANLPDLDLSAFDGPINR